MMAPTARYLNILWYLWLRDRINHISIYSYLFSVQWNRKDKNSKRLLSFVMTKCMHTIAENHICCCLKVVELKHNYFLYRPQIFSSSCAQPHRLKCIPVLQWRGSFYWQAFFLDMEWVPRDASTGLHWLLRYISKVYELDKQAIYHRTHVSLEVAWSASPSL